MTYYLFIQRKGERPRLTNVFPELDEWTKDALFVAMQMSVIKEIISKYKTIIIYR